MTNEIAPTAIIGPNVVLGEGNFIGAYAVIEANTTIGDRNWIGPHTVIGTPAEYPSRGPLRSADIRSLGPIRMGNDNTLREFTVVQAPVSNATTIGNGTYVMEKSHIAHDNILEDRVVISSGVILGGHAWIGEAANIGLGTITHQRISIGALAMLGMGSVVTKNIPPGAMAYGSPARVRGANDVGLRRWGLTDDSVQDIARFYAGDQSDGSAPEALLGYRVRYDQRIQELRELS